MKILISASGNEKNGLFMAVTAPSSGHDGRLFIDDKSFSLFLFEILTKSPFRQTAKQFLQNYKRKIGKALLLEVSIYKPDLVIVIQGDYFLREDIKKIRDDYNIPVINWLIHDPVLCEFYDPLRIINLADYSKLFIADELWMPCVYFFEESVTYLPLAGDPSLYKSLPLERDIDVLFVGDLFPPSPYITNGLVRARVLECLLKNNFQIQALVSGFSATKKIVPGIKNLKLINENITPENINRLYNRSKIVLNIFPLDYKKDFSASIYETALSKSFQLAEYKENGSKIFPEGVIFFKSQVELVAQIRKYLALPAERERLAEKAYNIAQQHTWLRRLQVLIHEAS